VVAAGAAAPARAITTVRVASGLDWPIYGIAPPGDPRLFIVEQPGFVRVLEQGQILPAAFLDIDSLVINTTGNDERGLLGLAFHPAYPDSPYIYVDYVNNANTTVIARYTRSADPDRIDHSTARIVLTIAQPYTNHKGGTLAFGPDGYLYVGMGDGGSAGDPQNRAQNGQVLLGKMLRIDVDHADPGLAYAIPPTNPFVGDAGFRDEIWAYGLRNPYRWSFDRATGDLWIADVGQSSWEEVDFQPAGDAGGEDYGWRLMEGLHCYNPPTNCGSDTLTLPIHEYDHNDLRCAITGGFVYRGDSIPGLAGAYFFADFCTAQIWTLRYDGAQVTELIERTSELAPGGGLSIADPAGFGQDGFGELYILTRGSGSDGGVFKIVAAGTGVEPLPARPALSLGAVAPNPFSDAARFTVTLSRAGRLDVEVLDVAGRLVAALASGPRAAGSYPLLWDGRDMAGRRAPSGGYLLRAALDGQAETRRLSLVR
jgi:glucose/arabinose dehydrogenase